MNVTKIEWTSTVLPCGTIRPGFSANPLKYRRKSDGKVVWACVKTSPGCAHCYSEAITLRYARGKLFNAKNMEELEPFLDEAELHKMLTAKTIQGVPVSGSKCFVGDMTDMFGEWVPDEMLGLLFIVFAMRHDVTWQILTKRAERMCWLLNDVMGKTVGKGKPVISKNDLPDTSSWLGINLPLPNVWLGVSVENRQHGLPRIELLRRTPAALRFLSIEPLLEDLGALDLAGIGWVIVGGESGPGARPMHPVWVRSIRDQCVAAGVPFFFKQAGNALASEWGCTDKKGGDIDCIPEEFRVREFPRNGHDDSAAY